MIQKALTLFHSLTGRTSQTGQAGLSLIEVLIGVVILGTAVAPAAYLLNGSLQGSEIRAEAARSLYLAQGKMEKLLALDFDEVTPGESLSDWVGAPDSVYRNVFVQEKPDSAFDNNLKKVTVTVGTAVITTYKVDAFEP